MAERELKNLRVGMELKPVLVVEVEVNLLFEPLGLILNSTSHFESEKDL